MISLHSRILFAMTVSLLCSRPQNEKLESKDGSLHQIFWWQVGSLVKLTGYNSPLYQISNLMT